MRTAPTANGKVRGIHTATCEQCYGGPWHCTLVMVGDRYEWRCVGGCVTCWACGVELAPDDRYPLIDGGETRLVCRRHFVTEPDERGNDDA